MFDEFDQRVIRGRAGNPLLTEALIELPLGKGETLDYGITSEYIEECARVTFRANVLGRLFETLVASDGAEPLNELDGTVVFLYSRLLPISLEMRADMFNNRRQPIKTHELLDVVIHRAEAEIGNPDLTLP